MKLLFFRLFMLTIFTSSLVSCGFSPATSEASGEVKTRLPWPQKDGSYALQIVELTGLTNLYELSGAFVQFFMSPSIVKGRLAGPKPKARFVKTSGLYIPSDDLSMQLAIVYGHMQNLALLDNEVGAAGVNHWPRDVGVAVRLTGGVSNNAFYDGDTDSMLFVPYVGKFLPISVNAGILAHEHFHSLFYKLVSVPLKAAGKDPGRISITAHSQEEVYRLFHFSEPKEVATLVENKLQSSYHILVMRGLNEGLADFWGWLYTGNPNFIADSLPSEKRTRTLTLDGTEGGMFISSGASLRENVKVLTSTDEKNLSRNINSYAYQIGTQFSRVFKAFTDRYASNHNLSSLEARKSVARLILKTLPHFKEDISNLKETDYYEPSHFLLSFLSQMSVTEQSECELMASVLNVDDRENEKSYACVAKMNAVNVETWVLEKQKSEHAENKIEKAPEDGASSENKPDVRLQVQPVKNSQSKVSQQ